MPVVLFRSAPGSPAPDCRASELVRHSVRLVEHERRTAREVARVALTRHGESLDRNAVDGGFPAGYSFFQVT